MQAKELDLFDIEMKKSCKTTPPTKPKVKPEDELLPKKIERAIKLLQTAAAGSMKPLEISYSGGKDSDVILELAKMSGIPYRAIYKNTTIDPPGTIKHCLEKDVKIVRRKSFAQVIQAKGYPNFIRRFCCHELKEYKHQNMKKIMFNDHYGLTKSVLEGRITMTRRIMPMILHSRDKDGTLKEIRPDETDIVDGGIAIFRIGDKEYRVPKENQPAYKIGEEVAIAQSYHALNKSGYVAPERLSHICESSKGYDNKMFVRADLMPHVIRITDIRVERLQDISDEECFHEGIEKWINSYIVAGIMEFGGKNNATFDTPRQAFASLIDKTCGKGTWEANPWVYVYTFELLR